MRSIICSRDILLVLQEMSYNESLGCCRYKTPTSDYCRYETPVVICVSWEVSTGLLSGFNPNLKWLGIVWRKIKCFQDKKEFYC